MKNEGRRLCSAIAKPFFAAKQINLRSRCSYASAAAPLQSASCSWGGSNISCCCSRRCSCCCKRSCCFKSRGNRVYVPLARTSIATSVAGGGFSKAVWVAVSWYCCCGCQDRREELSLKTCHSTLITKSLKKTSRPQGCPLWCLVSLESLSHFSRGFLREAGASHQQNVFPHVLPATP